MSEDTAVTCTTPAKPIGKLALALSKAQGEMGHAAKDAMNPHFKAKYADLASVISACREVLAKNELAILQPVSADGNKVSVKTILAHSSGEFIEETLTLTAKDASPQSLGSAISYGRRYGMASMLGITADDDDGNAASLPAEKQAAPVKKQNPTSSQSSSTAPSVETEVMQMQTLCKSLGASGAADINVLLGAFTGGAEGDQWKEYKGMKPDEQQKVLDGMKAWAKSLFEANKLDSPAQILEYLTAEEVPA